jgi:hypothetical protein
MTTPQALRGGLEVAVREGMFLLRLPDLLGLAFSSVAIGFVVGAASARRRTRSSRPVPVEPRPARKVVDVPWGE